MRELNIDKGLLNQYPKLETKKTSSGIVLLYSKDELLKINRKYSYILGLEKEEDILPHIKKYLNNMNLDEKKFLLLEQKQKNIKNTIFPLGIIKYDGKLVGTILHYFKNSIFLDEYLKLANTCSICLIFCESFKSFNSLAISVSLSSSVSK